MGCNLYIIVIRSDLQNKMLQETLRTLHHVRFQLNNEKLCVGLTETREFFLLFLKLHLLLRVCFVVFGLLF